ncbi:hypothetical protein ABZU76_19660 [Amycolatopsis sp. NPDC005232]|uniref:hypothetical protein n=1 Tax=Amycolatopsis sp. NPDC005232 TaxID=3157027 RepID=UPI0033B3CC78
MTGIPDLPRNFGGPRWRVYHLADDASDSWQERSARLQGELVKVLATPAQAAEWLAAFVLALDGAMYVWDTERRRWDYWCSVDASTHIRREAMISLGSGCSMYVSVRSRWGHHLVELEAIDRV